MNATIRTAPREDRVLTGPLIAFSIADELNTLKQEAEWISGVRNSVTIANTPSLGLVLTAIRKDATVCGHAVEGSVTLQVVSGAIRFTAAGETRELAAGDVIAIDRGVAHDVQASADSALLLTIIK